MLDGALRQVNAEEIEEMVAPIEQFLTEGEQAETAEVVASATEAAGQTILFTALESSTALTQPLCDERPPALPPGHNAAVPPAPATAAA